MTVIPSPSRTESATKSHQRLVIGMVVLVVIALAVTLSLLLIGGKKAVPGMPLELRAAAGRGSVTLDWRPGSGTTDHYVVYRDRAAITSFVAATTYTDTLTDTARHTYAVQAVNRKGARSAVTPVVTVAADVRQLNAAEKALLDTLPSELVDDTSCKPLFSGVDQNIGVAITCDPAAGQSPRPPGVVPTVVEAYYAASSTQLQAALQVVAKAH